ncbi:zeta toxin family protein [Fusobacterium sp.]|uniref:Zeta-toxin n=1 Tax=Fusobacterium nucleatum TaxID=851 RepID=A0A323UAP6_FUSNU|nr:MULTISPECIES: zeta toxin family protein [Fusobacterium]MBW9311096.1 zeta-toxin [Fusobacterium nucleatum]PCR85976.1 zeta-toxin [Fusobacterium nucleatum]PZA04808.1 zeta-toxin [Fusobacterium nucleatum]QJX50036.1 zeta toxin family protein [Fusobacterium nucleatum]HCE33588.1 zeta-toxin [Fusobacterium sp.]
MNNEKNYTDEEFQKVFQQILKFYKSRYSSQENPKAFLLGGQPGAGKSALENMINIENKYVSISGDDYRKFHPLYDKLNKIYGKDASKYTQKWSGEMVEYLLKEARKEKWNVILEGTLRKAELPIREAKDFKENGYSVELYVVAVKPEKSYLATLQRYEEMIVRCRIPRMTPKEHHDLVVNNIGNNLEIIYNSKAFDNIKLFDRENNLLYNYRENLDISPKNILEKEFYREWKIEEIKNFKEKWENLIKMVENREALFEEISELKNEKEKIFSKISNYK